MVSAGSGGRGRACLRVRWVLLPLLVAAGLAAAASAVDIPLRDGSVVRAKAYRISGSTVIVTLENGRQVAYDAADVDMAALAPAPAAKPSPPAAKPPAAGFGLAAAVAAGRGAARLAITDADVGHVSPEEIAGGAKKRAKAEGGQERSGGSVGIQGMQVVAAGPGAWEARGRVVNGGTVPASSVRVEIEARSAGGVDRVVVPAAVELAPGQAAPFSHRFTAASRPVIRARVRWRAPKPAPRKAAGAAPGAPGGTAAGTRAAKAAPAPTPVGPMGWGGAQLMKVAPVVTPTPRPAW